MDKDKLKQANFRLPEQLLEDLREVSKKDKDSQADIARKGIADKVKKLKKKYQIETVAAI